MKENPYLKDFYSRYDEDGRLASRHGSVEYLTTLHYIQNYLSPGARVLEIGAGTGRYSHALARQGYRLSSICEPQEDGGIAILYAAPGFLEECFSDQGLPVPDDIPAALAARGFCMAEGC